MYLPHLQADWRYIIRTDPADKGTEVTGYLHFTPRGYNIDNLVSQLEVKHADIWEDVLFLTLWQDHITDDLDA
jgi:hypothetical protein